jgi:hypothetical protein
VTPSWPCGSRARSPRGGDATSSVALNTPPRPRRVCANRPRAPCSPPPMATSRAPPCTPCVSRLDQHLHPLTFTHWASPCARATPRRTHDRSGLGRPHCRRVVVAAPVPALDSPRRPPARPSALRAQQPEEIQVGTPCCPAAQAPWNSSPAMSIRAAVALAGIYRAPRSTVACTEFG